MYQRVITTTVDGETLSIRVISNLSQGPFIAIESNLALAREYITEWYLSEELVVEEYNMIHRRHKLVEKERQLVAAALKLPLYLPASDDPTLLCFVGDTTVEDRQLWGSFYNLRDDCCILREKIADSERVLQCATT